MNVRAKHPIPFLNKTPCLALPGISSLQTCGKHAFTVNIVYTDCINSREFKRHTKEIQKINKKLLKNNRIAIEKQTNHLSVFTVNIAYIDCVNMRVCYRVRTHIPMVSVCLNPPQYMGGIYCGSTHHKIESQCKRAKLERVKTGL